MRKRLLTLVIALTVVLQTAWAYNFSATSPSGHTLYYEIISGTTNVGVVRPGTGSTYDNYVTGNVVIPATVTYGGTTYNVTELRSVNNYYGTFRNCSGLTSVTIPNSVTSIGGGAFYDCSGLTSVTIPNSVISIGGGAFYDCSGLTSVTIPNTVDTIKDYTFYHCSGLTSVTIPNSVTSIGERAFNGCSGLTSVTIPNSVTSIGDYAFIGCSGLTSVTIGNSVTSIGNSAFSGCSGLTSVTIPNSVTSIGNSAFSGCSGLTSVTIGNSVTSIGNSAFSDCSGLTSVTIPNSVTSIGYEAFYGCSGLTSVTIPNSVTTIGEYAFGYCSGLNILNFNAINCSNFTYNSSYGEYPPFYNCPIATINIGDSVQRIPAYFAYNLESLTSVTIPNSVTSIGIDAFYNVRLIIYNGTATGSPWGAFLHGGFIEDGFVYADSTKTSLFAYIGSDTNVVIPNSVTSIGDYVFSGCSGLTSVTIPNSVTSIGESAFYGCSGLNTLNFNAINCSNFTYNTSNYQYPPFYDCPISTINIGDSVQHIPACFAYYLDSLTSVIIGNSVTSIGDDAFYRCSGLTSVTIPNSVTSIGDDAFSGCSGLTSVTIGNSVTTIGNSAFSGCNNLRDVTSLAVTPPTLGTTVFSAAGILKVPCGSLSAYRYSSWLDYFTIMEEICDNMTITVTSANESMGTVSGSGEYAFGTVATITATPNEGYHFVSWNDGNTDNPRTITVTGNATYIATFEEGEEVTRYTITVLSANESMGAVSGGGEYEVGTEITITATPNEGYHFVSWNDGNTDNPRTITVTEDATYIATFEENVGIENIDILSELTFYPNPTSGIITFNRNDIMKVEVLDAMGRTLEMYENAYTIDISKLAKGYYAMRITTAEGVAVRKVIRK